MMVGIAAITQAHTIYPKHKNFSASDKERTDENCANSVCSGKSGIVPDALAMATKMKMDTREDGTVGIKSEIPRMAIPGDKPVIRYRVTPVGDVLANPSFFREETRRLCNDPVSFFRVLAERLTNLFLNSL